MCPCWFLKEGLFHALSEFLGLDEQFSVTPALCACCMLGTGSNFRSVHRELEFCLPAFSSSMYLQSVYAWCYISICDSLPCVRVCRIEFSSSSAHARRQRVRQPHPSHLALLDLTPRSVRSLGDIPSKWRATHSEGEPRISQLFLIVLPENLP